MKTFHQQFCECKEERLVSEGPLKKWKDHPELLPLPWSRAAKLIVEEVKVNPDAGLRMNLCGKFGGECQSGNEDCRKMRGL